MWSKRGEMQLEKRRNRGWSRVNDVILIILPDQGLKYWFNTSLNSHIYPFIQVLVCFEGKLR